MLFVSIYYLLFHCEKIILYFVTLNIMSRFNYNGETEEYFFIVLFDDNIWKELKKWMFIKYCQYSGTYLKLKTSNFDDYRNGDIAAYYGYLSLMIGNPKLEFTYRAINNAAKMGHLETIRWLLNRRDKLIYEATISCARNMEYNQLIRETNSEASNDLIKDDGLDRLKDLVSTNMIDFQAMNDAASGGYIQIVKLLNLHKAPYTKHVLKCSCHHGHLDVVIFLCEEMKIVCREKDLCEAVYFGRYEVTKYLYGRKLCFNEKKILTLAIKFNYIDIVEFFFKEGIRTFREDVIEGLIECNHLDMLIYLFNNNQDIFFNNHNLMNTAVCSGSLEALKWLDGLDIGTLTSEMFDIAAQEEYLDMVMFLYNHPKCGSIGFTSAAYDSGSLEIIKFLLENTTIKCNITRLTSAIARHELEIVHYLISNIPGFKDAHKEELRLSYCDDV